MSWHVSSWVSPVWDSLCLLDLIDHFLFHVREIFNYNLFKNFLIPFLFPGGSDCKASAYDVGDLGSIPGSGRYPGEGNGNPLQYSCLENPRDRGAWWAVVYGVAQSWIRLKRLSSSSSRVFTGEVVHDLNSK